MPQYQDDYYEEVPAQQPYYPPQSHGPNTDEVQADWLREEKLTNILQQLDPDNLLVDIERRIRGYKKDIFSKQWVQPKHIITNEICIVKFMSFLGSILNKNTIMSNYTPQDVNNIMEMVSEYISEDLADNAEQYGLKGNYTEMSRIGHIVCLSVFSCLKRAVDGMESRRFWNSMTLKGDVGGEEKKGGVLSALQFWR